MLPYQSILNLLGPLVDKEVSLIWWTLTSQISLGSSSFLPPLPLLPSSKSCVYFMPALPPLDS